MLADLAGLFGGIVLIIAAYLLLRTSRPSEANAFNGDGLRLAAGTVVMLAGVVVAGAMGYLVAVDDAATLLCFAPLLGAASFAVAARQADYAEVSRFGGQALDGGGSPLWFGTVACCGATIVCLVIRYHA